MEYSTRKNKRAEIQRQQDHWNEVHEQLLAVQKKSLSISNPGDSDEQEADDVARKVVNGESAEINGSSSSINRKGSGEAETTSEFQNQLKSQSGSGASLNESTRSEMESKMGADFSGVKIHTGTEANKMSESINAKAFTHGQDVYFKQGQYNPGSNQGKELLAHELVHTVQQGSGKVRPKIQRRAGDGENIKTDLATLDYRQALYDRNISFLIEKEIGQNLLEELGIKDTAWKNGKMTRMQAGALAYSFGMLALRNEYLYEKDTNATGTLKSGLSNFGYHETNFNESSIRNKAMTAKYEFDADKNQTKFDNKVEELVQFIFEHPDLSVAEKKPFLDIVAQQTGKTLNAETLFLDKVRQEKLKLKISVLAKEFFDKMISASWVDLSDLPIDKRTNVKMPDVFLGAVGDLSNSTGLGKSSGLHGSGRNIKFGPVGVGYFMYDVDSKKTTEADNTTPRTAYKTDTRGHQDSNTSIDSPIFNKNKVYIVFGEDDTDIQVRMAGYGFDTKDNWRHSPMNAEPINVTIYADGWSDKPIFQGEFRRKKSRVVFRKKPGVDVLKTSSSESRDRDGSITIKLDPVQYCGVRLRVEIDEIEHMHADRDEVQIQLSTSGKIERNYIPPPDTAGEKKSITFIPKPVESVEASQLFENSGYVANINYIKEDPVLKNQILSFAGKINESVIKTVIGGWKDLNDIFNLGGIGVNPESALPDQTKDAKPSGVTNRFQLQEYKEWEIKKLYRNDPDLQFDEDEFDAYFKSLRRATATLENSGTSFTAYTKEYTTDEELKEILLKHQSDFGSSGNVWSSTEVLMKNITTSTDVPPAQVKEILKSQVPGYSDVNTTSQTISVQAMTSPLGMQVEDGKFESNLGQIKSGSETEANLKPITNRSGGKLTRSNNDVLSALRSANFTKFLILQKAAQMDLAAYEGKTNWYSSTLAAFAKHRTYVTVKVTGEHGTDSAPKNVVIYLDDMPNPEVDTQTLPVNVQRKSMTISNPGDADETEADEVARKVVSGQSAVIHGTGNALNRKGEGAVEASPVFQSQLSGSVGGGQSLPEDMKSEMESKMGADFSGVKIHADANANAMSESISAKAFTHGQDVFFKQGEYDTNSNQGKELLAHELVHTVQQKSANSIQRVPIKLSKSDINTTAILLNDELKKTAPGPEAVLQLLQKLNRIGEFITLLHSTYNTSFPNPLSTTGPEKNSLTIDINDKFKDKSYDAQRALMLKLLTQDAATFNTFTSQAPEGKNKAAHDANADALNAALNATTPNVTAIYEILINYERDAESITVLKSRYKKKYGSKKEGLEEHLRSKLTDKTQLNYSLYLLNSFGASHRTGGLPGDSKINYGKEELADPANLTSGAVTGGSKIAGGGTATAYMDVTFPTGDKDIFGFTYTGGLAFDTHWLQFLWIEILAYQKDGSVVPISGYSHPSGGSALPKEGIAYTTNVGDKQRMVDSPSKTIPFYDLSASEAGNTGKNPTQFAADRNSGSTRMFDKPGSMVYQIYQALNDGAVKVMVIDHFDTFLVRDNNPLNHVAFRRESTYKPRTDGKPISVYKGKDEAFKAPTTEENIFEKGEAVTALPIEFHDTLTKYYPHYDFIK